MILAPSQEQLEVAEDMLGEMSALIGEERRAEVLGWLERGAYSAALGVLDELLQRMPHNLSLVRFRAAFHAQLFGWLVDRLGGVRRHLIAVREVHGTMGASYAAIVGSAQTPVTVQAVVEALGGDAVTTIEHVARLLRAGFLEFAGVALDRGARLRSLDVELDGEHGRPGAAH